MVRLVQFSVGDSKDVRIGVEESDGGAVVDVTDAVGCDSMVALLRREDGIASAVAAAAADGATKHEKGSFKLLAPVTGMEKVMCIGLNYHDHCEECGFPVPEEPVVFNKFPTSVCGPDDAIPCDSTLTSELDFEVELTIVIGKSARRVSKADAMDYVAGYTVAHDVSARDWQLKKNGGQWMLGKCMDNYAPIGPALVTTDELGDPHNLALKCILNGDTVQNSSTNQMIFKTDEIVEWVSRFVTLNPGDLILTGTPPGVGVFRKPPLYLKAGDTVTCEIEKIGSITNPVVADDSAPPAGK